MRGGANRAQLQQTSAALNGRLSAVSLFDLCQFLMLNRKTGTLSVRSEGKSAYFTFQDGQLMSALDEAFQNGEAVVLAAVQWPDGEFSFEPGPVPPERRIQASTENILLEAARRIDEMKATEAEEETPSREKVFRETQARAAELADAFRSAVSDSAMSAGQHKQWRSELLEALSGGECLCAILGPDCNIALAGPSGSRRIDGVPGREWRSWIRSLCSGERGEGPRTGLSSDGSLIRLNGMSLHVCNQGGRTSGSVVIRRLREEVMSWRELGLEDGIYRQLESGSSGPWIVLDSAMWRRKLQTREFLARTGNLSGREKASAEERKNAGNPNVGRPVSDALAAVAWAGPAACATGAWLRRRMEDRPGTAWVVEGTPFFDWTSVPGCVRSIHPAKLQDRGRLSDLCESVGAVALVLSRPWNPPLVAEAAELASQGISVAILDHAPDASAWLRRRRDRSPAGFETLLDGIAGIWSLWVGPETNRIDSTLVLPRAAAGAAGHAGQD